MFLIHNYILLRSYQYQVNLSDNETLVRVMTWKRWTACLARVTTEMYNHSYLP